MVLECGAGWYLTLIGVVSAAEAKARECTRRARHGRRALMFAELRSSHCCRGETTEVAGNVDLSETGAWLTSSVQVEIMPLETVHVD